MGSPIFDESNTRVWEIHGVLTHPGFKYIEEFFQDRIGYEKSQIDSLLIKVISNDVQKDALNSHIMKKNVYQEILWGLRESLEEKLKDKNFTDSDGAKYQNV